MWESFTSLLSVSIEQTSLVLGVNEAIAIILFTLLIRLLLLPISVSALVRTTHNKAKIHALKPATEKLTTQYKDNPTELAKKTMALYKKNNITFIDKISFANIFSQGVLGLGMFQTIKSMLFNSKFLWIETLGKPDVILAVIVGVLTYVSMILMPGSAEQVNQLIFLVPAVLSVLILISFPSAIGLYMAVSSIVSALQSVFISMYLQRKEREIAL
jgi:YidC/Oxa1 family membrane protein insertase